MVNRIILPHHMKRVEECQALFTECLQRYKKASAEADKPWTDQEIVRVSLKTLVKNGFTQVEIERAMQ